MKDRKLVILHLEAATTYLPMQAVDRDWLSERLADDIRQLSDLLQKDFSHWK